MTLPTGTPVMSDTHATVAMGHRLRLTQHVDDQLPACRNCSAGTSAICGRPTSAHQAIVCAVGVGVMQRHDGVRDKIKERIPHAKMEQRVTMWDTEKGQAILDVFYTTQQGAF
jgi:hypothetical protein